LLAFFLGVDLGLAACGPTMLLGFLGVYPFFWVLLLAVSLLQRVPFSNAKKEPKGFAPGVRHFA
jgi:hypothetical protein